jgi:hypothetical protein
MRQGEVIVSSSIGSQTPRFSLNTASGEEVKQNEGIRPENLSKHPLASSLGAWDHRGLTQHCTAHRNRIHLDRSSKSSLQVFGWITFYITVYSGIEIHRPPLYLWIYSSHALPSTYEPGYNKTRIFSTYITLNTTNMHFPPVQL